jgi:hypothetical protein
VGSCAWGMKFHPEVDAAALEGWYRGLTHAPAQAGVSVASARAADVRGLPRQRALSEARAADVRGQPRQRALSEAIFGGFAGVVADRAAA